VPIYNPAGLSTIAYRIGTFTSFRRAMLDRVNASDLLGATPNPFTKWHEGATGDFQTAFIELWAYLGDVLTFYQELIANEAYLGTASQRDSLRRLAALIDYHPAPGSGASGLVDFTLEKGRVVTVPAGFRVGSRAAPPAPASVFETGTAIKARAEHSSIPLSSVAPTNQFAPLASFGAIFNPGFGDVLTLGGAAESIYGSFGTALLNTFHFAAIASATPAFSTRTFVRAAPAPAAVSLARFIGFDLRSVVFKGTNTRLAPGDFVVTVENENAAGEKAVPRKLLSVTVSDSDNTTTVTWTEPAGATYQQDAAHPVAVYALRVAASPFGCTAPDWRTLPPTLTNSDGQNPGAPYQENWDLPSSASFFIPPGNTIALDGVYDGAGPGWIAAAADAGSPQAFRATDVKTVSVVGYTITSKVTRLTLKPGSAVGASTFPVRTTSIFGGAEKLELQNNLPLPDPVEGDTIILSGLYPNLQTGQQVVLSGNLFDIGAGAALAANGAESRVLAGPPAPDAENNITTIKLNKPLTGQYARAGATLMANIVEVTQGETVKDEVLGSSDGSALQSFALRKKPLTYVPSTDPEGVSAVESTLNVQVNTVRWNERPNLLGSRPDSQDYTTTLDDSGQTTVVFGDGINGARPPSGKDNIHARYRNGLGVSGNVATGGIAQLIDNLDGLQSVSNPQPASGGADQENISQIRVNAPNSVRTFGRAVSLADYAAVALSYPGIAKATASWVHRDENLKAVPQPYIALTLATADRVPLAQQPNLKSKLRSFLDARRDPNIPLRILDFSAVFIDVALSIDIDERSPHQATLTSVQSALDPAVPTGYFSFDRLNFGESIHLSALYAAVQAIQGVKDATVRTFRRMDLDAGDSTIVRDDLFIRQTEIAVIGNDPNQRNHGLLHIDAQGGFLDT
jgi:predicted phage baseplate assembly protein